LWADKATVEDKETFKLSATLDSGSKKISFWGIYTGSGALVAYCNNGPTSCSIDGLYVLEPTTSFHAEAKFTDGSIYKSNSIIIYLKSAFSRTQ